LQAIAHDPCRGRFSTRNGCSGGDVESSGEDAQSAEQELEFRLQKLMAPVESGSQRLLSDGHVAWTGNQQAESIGELITEVLQRKRERARGGERKSEW